MMKQIYLMLTALLVARATSGAPAAGPLCIQRLYTVRPAPDSTLVLNDYLTLEVPGLGPYLRAEEVRLKASGLTSAQAYVQARHLVLYLDDAPLTGLQSVSLHAGAGADSVYRAVFHLTRTPATYAAWGVVCPSPWQFGRPVAVEMGYPDRVITGCPAAAPKVRLRLQLVSPLALAGGLALVVGLAVIIITLARKSNLLRDAMPPPATPPPATPPAGRFSLAKSQLAWWTFLVLGGCLLVFCVTGALPTITPTTLELLSISAGTTGLSGLIGATGPTATSSNGWLRDVLSDGDGVSIHRVQQLGFALLLGLSFGYTVYQTLDFPTWSGPEILLLGLSSATYLGIKLKEKPKQ